MITIIPTSTAEHLAKKIRPGNLKIIFADKNKDGKRYFPDGEVYIKIPKSEKLKNKKVVILHSGAPNPNKGLIELELILQILKDNKIKPEIFFTYFPYGMQDKIFKKGETSATESLIKKLIDYYRVGKIYIIDPHFGGEKWLLKYPIINISAVPYLIKSCWQDFDENVLLLSPDKGGKRRTGFSGIRKKRLNSFKIELLPQKASFKGKTVGVVDDILETGGTLLKFCEFAKKSGAKKIVALITHGVLPTGISKIKKKYFKLYLTNTIHQKEANIDITDLILKTLL